MQEYKTEPPIKKNIAPIYQLPETDTTEYVMKWCQNHQQSDTSSEKSKVITNPEPTLNNSDFRESSNDESDWGKRSVEYNIVNDAIKFRKRYVKVRDKKKGGKGKPTSHENDKKDDSAPTLSKTEALVETMTTAPIFNTIKEFSAESGIVTLPSSKNDDFLVVDNKESFYPEENGIMEIPKLERTQVSE